MNVMDSIISRRSIRAYKDLPLEKEKLHLILEAGRLAPSSNNRQEWKFIIIQDAETRALLGTAAKGQKFVGEAPVILVMCATESERIMSCNQPAYTIDLSIALSFMMLEAQELGLGTCWLGAFYEDEVKKILNIPSNVRVVAMSPLGYPDESPSPRPRKSVDKTICYDKYE